MERELAERNIPFTPQQRIVISYKGQPLAKEYIADLVCFGQIIVEIKALKTLTTLEEAQLLNYLKAAGLPLGLLLNFGGPQLKWARFANTRSIRGPSRSFADESPGAR
jgi:GxxExxY protein